MTEWIQAISTVGFPIVACIALYCNHIEMQKALNNNTIALTKLAEKIEIKSKLE